MRIMAVSDVHTEHHKDKGVGWCKQLPVEADILMIMGDFANEFTFMLLRMLSKRFKTVLMVEGNHQHYGSTSEMVARRRCKVNHKLHNVHWLNNDIVELEGYRILGTPLWWDMDSMDSTQKQIVPALLGDFQFIPRYERNVRKWHCAAVKFLHENLRQGDILMTHHAPTYATYIGPEGRNDQVTNVAYHTDMDALIIEREPLIALHGHTHDRCETFVGETFVATYPTGYPDWEGKVPFCYEVLEF